MLPVCTLAGGPPVARHLAAASKACRQAVNEAWEDIVRRFPSRLYIVGGLNRQFKEMATVERYDPLLGRWESLSSLSTPRAGSTAETFAGRLYILGGELAGVALTVAERFDPWVSAWERLPDMNCGRIRPATAIFEGRIFVMGGFDGTRAMSSVECFDPTSRLWTVLPPMNRPRYASAATVHEGRLFIFGGELTDSGQRASVECFNSEARTWTLLPSVRSTLCGAALALTTSSSGCAAFALGGLGVSGQALTLAERIPLSRFIGDGAAEGDVVPEWVSLPPMPTSRHLASATTFRGGVVMAGGKGSTFEAVASVDVFSTESWSWEGLPPMQSPRLRAAVAGGRL